MKNQQILTNSVLVNLSISQYNPKRTDRKTTDEVLVEKNAKKSAGKWIKNLIDPEALSNIQKTSMRLRNAHCQYSLPWLDDGWRILPIMMYDKYQEEIKSLKGQFDHEVELFLKEWPNHVNNARLALNGMFKKSDYPDANIIQNTFRVKIDIQPLPVGDDFRVHLNKEELERLKNEVDERVQQATEKAMSDLWERLASPISNMVNRLSNKNGIFRNSLVNNLQKIIDMIPDLNVMNDPQLQSIAKECQEKLTKYDPETLRQSGTARIETLQSAEEILKKMEGYV